MTGRRPHSSWAISLVDVKRRKWCARWPYYRLALT